MRIRLATPADATACLGIYRPFIESSHSTFETDVPSSDAFAERMRRLLATHPWVVAAGTEDEVLGYAYASPFKDRAAYQWTAEVSVYAAEKARRRGVGRAAYEALFRCLRGQGYVNAVAIIALPNDASVRLHESLGFVRVGVFPRPGYKLGAWRDVGWWSLAISPPPARPAPPVPLQRCREQAAAWVAATEPRPGGPGRGR